MVVTVLQGKEERKLLRLSPDFSYEVVDRSGQVRSGQLAVLRTCMIGVRRAEETRPHCYVFVSFASRCPPLTAAAAAALRIAKLPFFYLLTLPLFPIVLVHF